MCCHFFHILRVHYECKMRLFHFTRYRKYFIQVSWTYFSYVFVTFLHAYSNAKIIKIECVFQSYNHKCTATFFRFTVYNII